MTIVTRIVGACTVLGLALVAGRHLNAQTSGGTLYACVHTRDGTIRIVSADTVCRNNETLVSWNTVGPQGPIGPTGPAGPTGPKGNTLRFVDAVGTDLGPVVTAGDSDTVFVEDLGVVATFVASKGSDSKIQLRGATFVSAFESGDCTGPRLLHMEAATSLLQVFGTSNAEFYRAIPGAPPIVTTTESIQTLEGCRSIRTDFDSFLPLERVTSVLQSATDSPNVGQAPLQIVAQ